MRALRACMSSMTRLYAEVGAPLTRVTGADRHLERQLAALPDRPRGGLLQRHDIDVLALQETKAREDQLPLMGLQALGYEAAVAGLNQWNGVAVLSRVGLEEVEVGFDGQPSWGEPAGVESRAIGATAGGVRIWSLYVPNGRKIDDPHYHYKLDWLARLRETAGAWLEDATTALVGDWNIAPQDEDVFDMAAYANDTHVTPPERAAFQAFLDDGWVDVVRPHAPGRRSTPTGTTTGSASSATAACASTSSSARPPSPTRVTGAFIDRDERAGKGRLRPRSRDRGLGGLTRQRVSRNRTARSGQAELSAPGVAPARTTRSPWPIDSVAALHSRLPHAPQPMAQELVSPSTPLARPLPALAGQARSAPRALRDVAVQDVRRAAASSR